MTKTAARRSNAGDLIPYTLSLPRFVLDSLETLGAQLCRTPAELVNIAVLSFIIQEHNLEAQHHVKH